MLVLRLVILMLILLWAFPTNSQERNVWPTSPKVYLNNTNASSTGLDEAIGWTVWLYNQRTGFSSSYEGPTDWVEDGPANTVVYTWGTLKYFLDNFTIFTKGVTKTYTYTGTNIIHKVIIYLNPLYFSGTTDSCEGLIITHEYLHAMGSKSHNDLAHSLMYHAPSHCRYFPLQEDIPPSPSCHAEVSPVYDVYIPNILGMQVFLKNEGNNLWSVDWYSEAAEVRCDTYTIGDGVVNLHGVRSIEGNWEVILKEQEGLWRLVEATQ